MSVNYRSTRSFGIPDAEARRFIAGLKMLRDGEGHLFVAKKNSTDRATPLKVFRLNGVSYHIDLRHTLWELATDRTKEELQADLLGCPDAKYCIEPSHQRPRLDAPAEQRFMRHIDRSAGPEGCWPWTGYTKDKGRRKSYGLFTTDGAKQVSAARFAYELENGPVPDDRFIEHTCGNELCMNPSHMRLVDAPAATQRRRTISGSSLGYRNVTCVSKRGKVALRVKVNANGREYYGDSILRFVELPRAVQIARRMREELQCGLGDKELGLGLIRLGMAGETPTDEMKAKLKSIESLYASPMVRSRPRPRECERMMTRYRRMPLTLERRGAFEPANVLAVAKW